VLISDKRTKEINNYNRVETETTTNNQKDDISEISEKYKDDLKKKKKKQVLIFSAVIVGFVILSSIGNSLGNNACDCVRTYDQCEANGGAWVSSSSQEKLRLKFRKCIKRPVKVLNH
jgi:hypothetical protein